MKIFCRHISELTETTENNEDSRPVSVHHSKTHLLPRPGIAFRGWILYDSQCRYCRAAAHRFARIFARRGFRFLPLQTPWAQHRLGLDPHSPPDEMRVLTMDDRDFGGSAAVIFLGHQVWWMRPFALLASLPGLRDIADRIYLWVAAHRRCAQSGCALSLGQNDLVSSPNLRGKTSASFPSRVGPWLGFAFAVLALFARNHVAPWIFMWLMSGTIFFACKWLTFSRAAKRSSHVRLGRAVEYFFLWPGMDAAAFLEPRKYPTISPLRKPIALAIGKILFGLTLLFFVARLGFGPLAAGWIGMAALVFILHFGLFDLAAIFLRRAGVAVRPVMDAPIKSTSLTEFWGRRWNGAFNQLVLDLFFRRLSRAIGTLGATLSAFFLSGLIHETVISLPAGGGYGLPTAYFVFQGCGVVIQRSRLGRIYLDRGPVGWIFTMLVTAGPAFWLFHPPFVRNVILPFMQAIHAL